MKSPTNETIYALLENLTKKVEDGFKGVHDRQDTTNGKVQENTAFRFKALGAFRLVWILGIIASIVGVVIKVL